MTEQEEIDDYRRVEAFLADPAVKRAIATVNERIFAEFKGATTAVAMESAWAKSKALDLLADELMRTMDAGKMALRGREDREKSQSRQAQLGQRRK